MKTAPLSLVIYLNDQLALGTSQADLMQELAPAIENSIDEKNRNALHFACFLDWVPEIELIATVCSSKILNMVASQVPDFSLQLNLVRAKTSVRMSHETRAIPTNAFKYYPKCTPAHCAVYGDSDRGLSFLTKRDDFEPDHLNSVGYTAALACVYGPPESLPKRLAMAEDLLLAGANPHLQSSNGYSGLGASVFRPRKDAIGFATLFKKYGGDPDLTVNCHERTPRDDLRFTPNRDELQQIFDEPPRPSNRFFGSIVPDFPNK